MKRTPIAGVASALLLAAALALGGCGDPASASSRPVASDISSESSQSSTESSLLQTPPVTGAYNGKTVTMKYTVETDVKISNANLRCFHNGFAVVMNKPAIGANPEYAYVDVTGKLLHNAWYSFAYPFDNDGRALVQLKDERWVYLDKEGNTVGEAQQPDPQPPAADTSMFFTQNDLWGLMDESGRHLTEAIFSNPIDGFIDGADLALVELAQGEHRKVLIDRTGRIRATMPDDCTNAYLYAEGIMMCSYVDEKNFADTRFQLYSTDGEPMHERRFKAIGNRSDGLIPVMDNGKVGLMDEQGRMIIEPALPLDNSDHVQLCLSEGLIIGSLNGNMVFIQVSRS